LTVDSHVDLLGEKLVLAFTVDSHTDLLGKTFCS
jgi:hypothetical protein